MAAFKVLVVEDSDSYLDSIKEILEHENYLVLTASDAASGWQSYQDNNPDVSLVDLNLVSHDSHEDGLWLTDKITQSSPDNFHPVILMSSQATEQDQLAGYNSGCFDYLAKPFDPRLMLAKLTVIMRFLNPRPD